MKPTLRALLLWALRKLSDPVLEARERLICEECGGPIRKRDRYRILKARHLDCKDARLLEPQGQLQLTALRGDSTDEKG